MLLEHQALMVHGNGPKAVMYEVLPEVLLCSREFKMQVYFHLIANNCNHFQATFLFLFVCLLCF